MGATIRADSSSDRTAELLWAHEYGQRRPNKFVELYIPVGFWYVARRLTLEISSHPLFLPVSPPLEVAFCGLVLCQLSRRGYSRKLRSLTSRTSSPTPISGFPQTWCTYGGLAGTINGARLATAGRMPCFTQRLCSIRFLSRMSGGEAKIRKGMERTRLRKPSRSQD
jgi:hypothetical protein